MKKSILFLLTIFTFTVVNASSIDSTIKSTTDTSLTFKTLYSDIKSGISALSAGLKVGAEHVYKVLIKQQLVNSIVWILVGLIPLSILLIYGKKLYNWAKRNEEDSDGMTYAGLIVLWILLLVPIIISICYIDVIITGFVNPEYGAIKEILSFVK